MADRKPTSNESLPPASNEDELEFLRAMDEYIRRNDRLFPTWGEVLGVLRQLGYQKANHSSNPQTREAQWRAFCSSLIQERAQLQIDIAKLREENLALSRSLGYLLFKDEPKDLDVEALLREAENQPPLAEVIAELEMEMVVASDDKIETDPPISVPVN